MKNKLDNILLSILWLSASTLVACFWFNIKFGFNIFSGAHWRHLAYMQANQAPVNTTFYISIIASVAIIIAGLYMLIRPHIRKITLPVRDTHKSALAKKATTPTAQKNTSNTTPATVAPAPQAKTPETHLIRPARLNLGAPLLNQTESFTAPAATAPVSQTATHAPQTNNWPEINEIYEQAGYTLKKTPRIAGLQTSLFAIGTDETLWIGAVGVEISAMQNAIDTLQQIFSDTLEDIIINVQGFIISPRNAHEQSAPEILTFDSIDSLRNYMNQHQNTPPSDDELENFEAFSSYISTVIEYLGKM